MRPTHANVIRMCGHDDLFVELRANPIELEGGTDEPWPSPFADAMQTRQVWFGDTMIGLIHYRARTVSRGTEYGWWIEGRGRRCTTQIKAAEQLLAQHKTTVPA